MNPEPEGLSGEELALAGILDSIEVPSPRAADTASLVTKLQEELVMQHRNTSPLLKQLTVARAQLLIFPVGFWVVSALVLIVGVGLIVVGLDPSRSLILYLIGPLLAYVGMESAFSTASAPVLELELATPISPRLLAIARLVVMFGYEIAVGLALSVALALTEGGALLMLVTTWLMPLFLASGLTLVLAARLQVDRAATVVYALWTVAVLAGWRLHGPDISLGTPLEVALACAGLILIATSVVFFSPTALRSGPRTFSLRRQYPES